MIDMENLAEPFTAEEEKLWFERLHSSDYPYEIAFAKIVEHNYRLVRDIANRYRSISVQDWEDDFVTGVIGLSKAVRKFDPTLGNKFSTYATWLIRGEIGRARETGGNYCGICQIPVAVHRQITKIKKLAKSQNREAQEIPVEEIRAHLNCKIDGANVVHQLLGLQTCLSYDQPLVTGRTMSEVVGTTPAELTELTETNDVSVRLGVALNQLPTHRRQALLLFFGGMNQTEVARELGKSRPWVDSLIKDGLRDLRQRLDPQAFAA